MAQAGTNVLYNGLCLFIILLLLIMMVFVIIFH